MSALDASIVPITLTVNGRTGLTLWAPPWEDDEGEEWQGFLGDGAKILLFPNPRELADFIASGVENDLSDHPAWGRVLKLTPDDLRPSPDDAYDLDQVYEWAADDPDPVHVSALANVVDMVEKIADCCDDGALRRLVGNTPEYEELVSDDVSYQGKDGRKRWNALGDVIADSWERALTRVSSWLEWRGDFTEATELDDELTWDRVGAEPIELVLPTGRFLTVRGYIEDEAVFLGDEDNVAIFTEPSELGTYCRTATGHALTRLDHWPDLAGTNPADDEEMFSPDPEASYDLTAPSSEAGEVLRELVAFCRLDVGPLDDPIDAEKWATVVEQVETCLQQQD